MTIESGNTELDLVAKVLPEPLLLLDGRGLVVDVNEAARSLLFPDVSPIGAPLASLVEAGEAPPSATAEWLHERITRCATLRETLDEADLIVEAIIENPEAKRALYAEVDRLAPDTLKPGTVWQGAA